LHELGHTLGGVHEAKKDLLLFPTHDSQMSSFGPAATDLLTISFTHRAETPSGDAKMALWKDLLASYENAPDGDWDAKEKDEMIARLRTALGIPLVATKSTASASPSASSSAPPAAIVAPSDLKPADASTFIEASKQFQAGKYGDSWKTATPLFAAYPDVYDVQDLRCKLAMKQGFDWKTTKAECAQLMKLSTKK
jgi:hypothetical protein